jgi:aldose sugar dehydrogenase
MPKILTCFIAMLALAAATVRGDDVDYVLTTVADGLELPWGLAFLPDGGLLVTERPGRLRRVAADGTVSPPLDGVPPVFFRGQGGLLDVALHPDFADNGLVYLSYAHGNAGANATRIAPRVLGRGPARQRRSDLHRRAQQGHAAALRRQPGVPGRRHPAAHHRRRLRLPRGSAGRERSARQDRAHRTTTAASRGQPLRRWRRRARRCGRTGTATPRGSTVDPVTGRVYQHEHGPRGGDELNLLRPGRNYGWPMTTHGVDYTGAYVSPFTELPGIEPPLHPLDPVHRAVRARHLPRRRVPRVAGRSVRRRAGRPRGAAPGAEGRAGGRAAGAVRRPRRAHPQRRVGPDGHLYLVTDSTEGG